MKMSEAFSLPVKSVYERDYCGEYFSNVYDKHGDILLPCVSDDVDCEAIVKAINNHDALVEENEKLTEIIEKIIESSSTRDGGQFSHYWSEKLKEAKS